MTHLGSWLSALVDGQLPPDEDCAKSVLFFVSDYSRVISGTSIDINGGEYMAS